MLAVSGTGSGPNSRPGQNHRRLGLCATRSFFRKTMVYARVATGAQHLQEQPLLLVA